MNPNNLIQNLSQGLATCTTQPAQVIVQSAPVVQTTQIANPAQTGFPIDICSINKGSNEVVFNFNNQHTETVTYWFGLIGDSQGMANNYNIENSALDQPLAFGSGYGTPPTAFGFPNGGEFLAQFNNTLLWGGAIIASRLSVSGPSTGPQRSLPLLLFNANINRQQCDLSRQPGLCPVCPQNTIESDTFIVEYSTLAIGRCAAVGVQVAPGAAVEVRISVAGMEQVNMVPVNGGSCTI